MRLLCPWSGMPCDCKEFPWIEDGTVPKKCEDKMSDALLGIRKVSPEGLKRFKAYEESLTKKS